MTKKLDLKKEVKAFQKKLKKYPHQDISEYTRLQEALEDFINYGAWEEDEDED